MSSITEQFEQAEVQWDLPRLYKDLANIKGKGLTPVEKLHLRGLLCGLGPSEIAAKLNKNPDSVRVDLCNRIYQYIKGVTGKDGEKVENWRNLCEWLEEAGYKEKLTNSSISVDSLPIEAAIKIKNIQQSKIKKIVMVEINMRFIAPLPNGESSNEKEVTDKE
jgi:hypothetical protein